MILIYVGAGILLFLSVLIYLLQEKIILFIWKRTARERLVKIVIHYESNFYKIYYRLIPENKFFLVDKMRYFYDNKYIIKGNIAVDTDADKIQIDHKRYDFKQLFGIKNKKDNKFIEIHYFYNNPMPICFDNTKIEKMIGEKGSGIETVSLTSHEFTRLYEDDLFIKLLSISDEKKLLMFVIFMNVIIIIISAIMAVKVYNLIQ